MTRIKICGITNLEDARAAISYGADALGFITVLGSPRRVDRTFLSHYLREIAGAMGPFVKSVLVTTHIDEARGYPATRAVQYYKGEPMEHDWSIDLIRVVRVKDEESLAELAQYSKLSDAFHLDTHHKDKLGGAGETFNWDLAVEAKKRTDKPIILAGGLTPENVQDAIAKVRPYAVDVSSGVEAEPGRKDHGKLKAFIHAVREYDLKYGD